jgi:hypothetical protein
MIKKGLTHLGDNTVHISVDRPAQPAWHFLNFVVLFLSFLWKEELMFKLHYYSK